MADGHAHRDAAGDRDPQGLARFALGVSWAVTWTPSVARIEAPVPTAAVTPGATTASA